LRLTWSLLGGLDLHDYPLSVLLTPTTNSLLAYAGFDARDAVKFWENRDQDADCSSSQGAKTGQTEGISTLTRGIMGSTHPVNEVRIERLKQELERWKEARLAALAIAREENSESPGK